MSQLFAPADPFVSCRNDAHANAANLRNSLQAGSRFKRHRVTPGSPRFEHTAHHPSLTKAQHAHFERLKHPTGFKEPFHDFPGAVTYGTLPRFVRDTESRNFDPRSPNYRGSRRRGQGQAQGSGRSKSRSGSRSVNRSSSSTRRPNSSLSMAASQASVGATTGFTKRISPRLGSRMQFYQKPNSGFQYNPRTGGMRRAARHTYLRRGMYTALPETEVSMRCHKTTREAHMVPYRPSSSIGAVGADRESRRQFRKSPRQFRPPGRMQASYTRNSSSTGCSGSFVLGTSQGQQGQSLQSQSSSQSGDAYAMIPGLLRAATSRVCLDNMPTMRVFSVRVPITNHTARCLVHIHGGQLVLARRNIWAEIQSHPTLLAPKMTGEIIIVVKSSFPGVGFVEVSYLGEPLVTLEITAVKEEEGGGEGEKVEVGEEQHEGDRVGPDESDDGTIVGDLANVVV